jgi:hypothetical protein
MRDPNTFDTQERAGNEVYYTKLQEHALHAQAHSGHCVFLTILTGWDKENRSPGGQMTPIYWTGICSPAQAKAFAKELLAAIGEDDDGE